MKGSVFLGMSGGVDSSVAAILLKEDGYNVSGITFLFGENEISNNQIVNDAKELAKLLKIKHIVVDLRERFRSEIIAYFLQEYKNGKTPFPCAKCNPHVKFVELFNSAEYQNIDFIATGHYSRIQKFNGSKYIYTGIDSDKDQSFFLWGLNSKIREKLLLPLGNRTKNEVREIAKQRGFIKLSNKKDSLGVCFIQGKNYRNFLESKGIISDTGNFLDVEGNILGQHKGIINYTIGQRRGLGINLNSPVFVSEIRVESNEIVLSNYSSLYREIIYIKNTYFVDIDEVNAVKTYNLKIRYRLQNTPCNIIIQNNSTAKIVLLEKLAMVSAGQTTVFYDGERVIGGGFIKSSE